MNYDLCSGTCLKKSGIYSVAMFHVGASVISLAPTFFFKSQSALILLLLLSTCDPLRWARRWWAALRAAIFRFWQKYWF